MSAFLVLPFVWATAPPPPPELPDQLQPHPPFYRKYTEALLRRYLRMSMEAGKVPSLLGQEMFRGKVTSYRIGCFDDAVIFVHDVEHCLLQLTPQQQDLVSRIGLQQFSVAETAELLGVPPRSVIRRYGTALDRLTHLFLNAGLLEQQNSCQGV